MTYLIQPYPTYLQLLLSPFKLAWADWVTDLTVISPKNIPVLIQELFEDISYPYNNSQPLPQVAGRFPTSTHTEVSASLDLKMYNWHRRKGAFHGGFWTLFFLWLDKPLVCWLFRDCCMAHLSWGHLLHRVGGQENTVPETKHFSMLSSSERWTLKESIIAKVLNRLTHQCEVWYQTSLGAALMKVFNLEACKSVQPPKIKVRRSPVMTTDKVILEGNRPLLSSLLLRVS